jgi:hypothetical protein
VVLVLGMANGVGNKESVIESISSTNDFNLMALKVPYGVVILPHPSTSLYLVPF